MPTITHILIWGGILSIASSVILFGSWWIEPRHWGHDLAAERSLQNRIIKILILFAVQLLIMVWATIQYEQIRPELGFVMALVINYLIYQVFNLCDLIVLDWLVYMKMKPAFIRPADLPIMDDIAEHVEGFWNGLFIAIVPVLLGVSIWAIT
ncbi:MAG: hypothetical protein AAF702_06630 [Chloroflexota bacterium]